MPVTGNVAAEITGGIGFSGSEERRGGIVDVLRCDERRISILGGRSYDKHAVGISPGEGFAQAGNGVIDCDRTALRSSIPAFIARPSAK